MPGPARGAELLALALGCVGMHGAKVANVAANEADLVPALGVGQHQLWAMQHYRSRRPRGFLSSLGFGTMGYGLPAAIGAKGAGGSGEGGKRAAGESQLTGPT